MGRTASCRDRDVAGLCGSPRWVCPYPGRSRALRRSFLKGRGVLVCHGGWPAASVPRRMRNFSASSGTGQSMNTSFFGELLQTISDRGRALIDRTRERRGNPAARSESLIELCEELLSGRGEASGVARAREILTRYDELTTGPRIAFFETLAPRFGSD